MAKASSKTTEAPARDHYTVLARRYRPGAFKDLVGQDAVAQVLTNAIKNNRVGHAYLFTGARGVGKTSAARILAKALNCEKGPTDHPCGTCSSCMAVSTGEDVDVLEIDGASNRGIEEVREIRSNIQYRPSRSRYKIYIIDEVHMLSGPAFNALLKTLEEPPSHVKFIFATTEVQKIPVTILSRCQRFDFVGIPTGQITKHLTEIITKEGLDAESAAVELIARRAGGSMRDAQSLLDQALAFSSGKLLRDDVNRLIGMVDEERILELAEAVVGGDAAKALNHLDKACERGLQMGELVEQMMTCWRDMMVLNSCGALPGDTMVSTANQQRFADIAKSVSLDNILAGMDVFSLTRSRLKNTHQPRMMVELGLIRVSRLKDLMSVAQLIAQIQSGGLVAPVGTKGPPTLPPEGLKKKFLTDVIKAGLAPGEIPTHGLTEETLGGIWPQVLSGVGPMLGNELKKAGLPAISGPYALVLEFPKEYNQAMELCQEPGRTNRIQEVLLKLTAQPWQVRMVLGSASSSGTPSRIPAQVVEQEPPKPRENTKLIAEKDPLVQRALEVFNAQIVRADQGFGVYPPKDKKGDSESEEE